MQEVVDIERPEAALVISESGLPRGLPFNKRATRLLWCHASQYRLARHPIAGPVFVAGRRNEDNQLTSVPDELLKLLLHTVSYKVEVQTHGDEGWYGNELRFTSWEDAYDAALSVALRWTAVVHVRVVPAVE